MPCCYVTLQYTATRLLHIGVYARFRFISQTAAGNWSHFSNDITKNIGFGENIWRSQKGHLDTFVLTFNIIDNICCAHGIFNKSYLTINLTIPVPAAIFELASANLFQISFLTLCLCHYVPTMSLCCVVHTEDIEHHCEFFFAFAWPCRYIAISLVWIRPHGYNYRRNLLQYN